MSINIAKILQDPTTSQKVFNRVLRDNDMQVVKKFSPVVSEYKFQLTPTLRQTLTLTEDEFVTRQERFKYGQWKNMIEIRSRGSMEQLENDLIMCIENLKEALARYPKKYHCKKL